MNKFQIFGKSESVYNVDESEFPLNNSLPQIISEKLKLEFVSLTNIDKRENRSMLLSTRNGQWLYSWE
jgi:hypothetical protein